jgi:hypothetical protein
MVRSHPVQPSNSAWAGFPWQVERREFLHETEAHCVNVGSQADEPRTESAMDQEQRERQACKVKPRTMSASARRRIAATQRARWAKVKAARK